METPEKLIVNEKNNNTVLEKYEFDSADTKNAFSIGNSPGVTEAYLYLIDKQVASFALMMKEELEFGFLHYHILDEHKADFIKAYPVLDGKTNQVLYIYTAQSRRRTGLASAVLDFLLNDMKKRDYRFVWLRDESGSKIYKNLGFWNFQESIPELLSDPESFFQKYEETTSFDRSRLKDRFGDVRLVKSL